MKTLKILCLAGSALALVTGGARGQGSLTPSGAPGPTMRTLTQVEPRTPITSTPFVITNSGSYYLAQNLNTTTNGIIINASDVTVDLMGFKLTGPTNGTLIGIEQKAGHIRATVRNGTVAAFQNGGILLGDQAVVEQVTVLNCENETGVKVGSGSRVHQVTANGNGTNIELGPFSRLTDSVAMEATGDGVKAAFGSLVSGTIASSNDAHGFYFSDGSSMIRDSMADFNNRSGIVSEGVGSYSLLTIVGCKAAFNKEHGFRVDNGGLIRDSHALNNGNPTFFYYDIQLAETSFDDHKNVVDSCVTHGASGINAPGSNIVVRSIQFGAAVTSDGDTLLGAASTHSAGGTVTNERPLTNLRYGP